MRVACLTCPGPLQEHLVRRIATEQTLVGWLTMSTPRPTFRRRVQSCVSRYRNPVRLAEHLEGRRACRQYEQQAQPLFSALFEDDVPELPGTLPRRHVHDVNTPEAIEFLRDLQPDCLVVYGTNLLRDPYFDGRIGDRLPIINLHTGLSPYSRGGNCNLFCILHGQLQLVGVTVHHIDRGVDSGDIIFSARPSITEADTFERLELKACRLGEDLMMQALREQTTGDLVRHPQREHGRLFLKRTGYIYRPYHRFLANQLLSQGGLVKQYLAQQSRFDEGVMTHIPKLDAAHWRHAET